MNLAARGARNMDSGEDEFVDEVIKRQLQKQARRVYFESILVAIFLTILFLIVPLPS